MNYSIHNPISNSLNRKLIILFICSMCIVFVDFADERGINQLLIAIMAMSPIILVLTKKRLYNYDIGFALFWLMISIFSQYTSLVYRFSTIGYLGMFISTYLAFMNLLNRGFLQLNTYVKLLRFLIFLFTGVLIIQQLCVLFGLPILNGAQQIAVSKWKLNSLTLEPSHAARVLFIFMYSYVLVKGKIENKKYDLRNNWKNDKLIWISLFWSMITMVSSTAIILLCIIFLKVFFVQTKSIVNIILGAVLFYLIFSFLIPDALIERPVQVIKAIFTLQPGAVVKADDSASFRVVPLMVILRNFDLFNLHTWIGFGIDYDKILMYRRMGERLGEAGGGGVFALMLNYGLISFILFMYLLYRTGFSFKDPFGIVLWILFFSLGGPNTQVFWAIQMFYACNKYFVEKRMKKRSPTIQRVGVRRISQFA